MRKTTVTLNDKGIVAVVGLTLILTFGCGFMTSQAMRVVVNQQEFTVEDAETLLQLQEIENERYSGVKVYGSKDTHGDLQIRYERSERREIGKH